MKKTFKISESFSHFQRKLAGKKIVVTCDRSKFVSISVTVRSVAGVALKKLGAWGRGPARPKKIYITGAEPNVCISLK